MPPRVLALTPSTIDHALSRRTWVLVRLAHGARGLPAGLVRQLDGRTMDPMLFATFDVGQRVPPGFWKRAFRTGLGPVRHHGTRPPDGYYLFRHGLVVAHHAAHTSVRPEDIGAYLAERLDEGPKQEEQSQWVYEQRVEPGAGWRGHGSGRYSDEQGRDRRSEPEEEEPRHHRRSRERSVPEPPPAPEAPDPYAVLGVAPDCSDKELKAAYRAALKMNHPDRVAHLSPALQAFALAQTQAIRDAWDVVKEKRGL